MTENKKTNIIAYTAMGISIVALGVAILAACPKHKRYGFESHQAPRPEMMVKHPNQRNSKELRRDHDQRPDMRVQKGAEARGVAKPNTKPSFGGDTQNKND